MPTIYLDHNATTPLDLDVRAAMLPFLAEIFGNPSSIHIEGRRARACLDQAREELAASWGCTPSELVFTSGGTEANNLAIFGAARARREHGRHLITSAIEHPAVLVPMQHLAASEGYELTIVGTDPFGFVDPNEVDRAVRADTILVSVMAANNEVGTIQPVAEIGRLCRERGILFHTDSVQWVGKQPMGRITGFEADLVTCCAHKLYGPKGAGCLYVRSPLRLQSHSFGGSQEDERRPGTENLAAIVGLVAAVTRFTSPPVFDPSRLGRLTEHMEHMTTALPGIRRWGAPGQGRLANTLALTATGCDSLSLLAGLDLAGVCASSGSACSVGSLKPSHVLTSLGASPEQAAGLVRFSLGRDTILEDIEAAAAAFAEVVTRVRNAPGGGPRR